MFKTIEQNQKHQTGKLSDGFAIIDSDDGKFKYKVGVIDFLTKYTSLKLLENEIVSTIGQVDRRDVSAIDEDTYQDRFIKFMKENMWGGNNIFKI